MSETSGLKTWVVRYPVGDDEYLVSILSSSEDDAIGNSVFYAMPEEMRLAFLRSAGVKAAPKPEMVEVRKEDLQLVLPHAPNIPGVAKWSLERYTPAIDRLRKAAGLEGA